MRSRVVMASVPTRFATAFRMNHYQYVRRRLNLALLVAVPAFFVTVAFYVFPPQGSEVARRDHRMDSVIALLGLPIHEVTQVQLTGRRAAAIFLAVSLGAGIYAAMGVFVGALVKRPMEGSYLMFALPFSDIVL